MIENNSPWLKELNENRPTKKLQTLYPTDVAVVGGGIAGMVTAFFILKHTDKKVTIVECNKIAHGATGHNAGQVVDYFERPFSDLVEEFGLKLAADAQKSINSAWDLLAFILEDTKIDIPFSKFMGYAACASLQHLNVHFQNKYLKQKAGIEIHKVLVSKEFEDFDNIDKKYQDLYEVVPYAQIQEVLETKNTHYIAALRSHKGCLNSALFVEKLAEYMLKKYPDRFTLFEHTPVKTVNLYSGNAVLYCEEGQVLANHVVLCTNGFENIHIHNKGSDKKIIDRKFHSMVYGIVGYMAGYIEERHKNPIAISYFSPYQDIGNGEPYFYLTRRNFKNKNKDEKKLSLVCVGGPENVHENEFNYYRNGPYPQKAQEQIGRFLEQSFMYTPKHLKKYDFTWHGLMGYTENCIRRIGPEPLNRILLYNLGCNGIGILPSIYGGKKIADHIAGKDVPKTIFDPVRK